MTEVAQPEWVDEVAAAAIIGFAPGTLRQWRVHGGGPPYAKFGKSRQAKVRYHVGILRDWVRNRLRNNTSE